MRSSGLLLALILVLAAIAGFLALRGHTFGESGDSAHAKPVLNRSYSISGNKNGAASSGGSAFQDGAARTGRARERSKGNQEHSPQPRRMDDRLQKALEQLRREQQAQEEQDWQQQERYWKQRAELEERDRKQQHDWKRQEELEEQERKQFKERRDREYQIQDEVKQRGLEEEKRERDWWDRYAKALEQEEARLREKAEAYARERKQWQDKAQQESKERDARAKALREGADEYDRKVEAAQRWWKNEADDLEAKRTRSNLNQLIGIGKPGEWEKELRKRIENSKDRSRFMVVDNPREFERNHDPYLVWDLKKDFNEQLKQWEDVRKIDKMGWKERLDETLKRVEKGKKLEGELLERVKELRQPESLGAMAVLLGGWGVGHFFGYGEAVDVFIGLIGYLMLGESIIDITEDLYKFVTTMMGARTDEDFEKAADHFAKGISKAYRDLGMAAGGAVVGKGASKVRKALKELKDAKGKPITTPEGTVRPLGLTSRSGALDLAKQKLGIPRSQQPTRQWQISDPKELKGFGVRDPNPRNQGIIYEYEIPKPGGGTKKVYVIDHGKDPTHGGTGHVHTGTPKPGASSVEPGGRYTEVGEPIPYENK